MVVKVATTCLNWSQSSVPHSPSSPQTLASAISSPSSKRRSIDGTLAYRSCVHGLYKSAPFGSVSTKLHRSRSCENLKSKPRTIKRACTASLDAFSDEEFFKQIEELAFKFQLSDSDCHEIEADQKSFPSSRLDPVEPPDWAERDEIVPANIERKANSVGLPLSLRIIKRKKQWEEGFREAGESAYSSVKKAFSSMVFIIRELQSYSLLMREVLFYEDLQGILVRVQKEMNASFVWLFQQVFSHTPTLMVYVMILLANYSVYSMSTSTAIAATTPLQATTESVSVVQDRNYREHKFDSSAIKTSSVSSSGKTTLIGGNNGGGGKFRSIGSGTDGDGRSDGSLSPAILPDGASSIGNPTRTSKGDSVCGLVTGEEEVSVWNSIVEEASGMQAVLRDEALDEETVRRFVSPVTAKMEADDYADYFRTELLYQTGLAKDPSNTLLLANYAQFLYLVAHDYDRAEEYFKRAVKVEPKDAEALGKYASFLWQARNDLWAAEETYLDAIAVDPTNSYYAASYAHFLWNTGGEDTCFPLSNDD